MKINSNLLFLPLFVLLAQAGEAQMALTEEQLKNTVYHLDVEVNSKGQRKQKMVQMKDGEYEEFKELTIKGQTQRARLFRAQVSAVVFGDLNRDGNEDAGVILTTTGGGSGIYVQLAVVLNTAGQPDFVGTETIGDRVGIEKFFYESGALKMIAIIQGDKDPMCCPTERVQNDIYLVGRTLVRKESYLGRIEKK